MSYVGLPPGAIAQFAGSVAPTGWLVCDGSAVSRVTYADLFAAIGTTYGPGDGSSTFNLPDTKGRALYGQGTHSDVATLGNNEGASVANRRAKHKHTVNDPGHHHSITATKTYSGATAEGLDGSTGTYDTTTNQTGITVGPQTGSEPVDSGAYLVVRHIIKV